LNARHILLCLVAGALLATATAVAGPAEDAAQRYAEGQRRLAASDFDGALKAYEAAVAADKANADYQQQCAILRQVVQLRAAVAQEAKAEKRDAMSRALRSFYYEHRLYAEALPLDQAQHDRAPSAESASLLAETLLEMGRNAEAEAALAPFAGPGAPLATRIFGAIAQARQGRLDRAREIANGLTLPETATNGQLYHAARLQALLGQPETAAALLTRAFQATAPSALASARARARSCPDFASVASSAAFTAALETASKLSQSKCSAMPSCGGCPQAKACGHAKPTTGGGSPQ
jgi:tetratricopeptide (TPR) repeat protein